MKLACAIISISLFFSIFSITSCMRCTQEIYAVYIPEKNIIRLHDDATIMSPITPEGPFSKDNHVLIIKLKGPIEEYMERKLVPGEDIKIYHNYAKSGYIIIHKDRVEVKLKYSRDYYENHNGQLELRIKKSSSNLTIHKDSQGRAALAFSVLGVKRAVAKSANPAHL